MLKFQNFSRQVLEVHLYLCRFSRMGGGSLTFIGIQLWVRMISWVRIIGADVRIRGLGTNMIGLGMNDRFGYE